MGRDGKRARGKQGSVWLKMLKLRERKLKIKKETRNARAATFLEQFLFSQLRLGRAANFEAWVGLHAEQSPEHHPGVSFDKKKCCLTSLIEKKVIKKC